MGVHNYQACGIIIHLYICYLIFPAPSSLFPIIRQTPFWILEVLKAVLLHFRPTPRKNPRKQPLTVTKFHITR